MDSHICALRCTLCTVHSAQCTHMGEILDGGTGSTWPYLHAQHQAFLMCGPFKAKQGEGGREGVFTCPAGTSQWATAGGCWTCCLLLLLVTAPVCTLPNTWGPAPCTAPAPGLSSKMRLPATPMEPNAMGCAEQQLDTSVCD